MMTKPSAVSFIAIILIDLPVWVHSWLAADWLIKWLTGQLQNAPGGHRDHPQRKPFLKPSTKWTRTGCRIFVIRLP